MAVKINLNCKNNFAHLVINFWGNGEKSFEKLGNFASDFQVLGDNDQFFQISRGDEPIR